MDCDVGTLGNSERKMFLNENSVTQTDIELSNCRQIQMLNGASLQFTLHPYMM